MFNHYNGIILQIFKQKKNQDYFRPYNVLPKSKSEKRELTSPTWTTVHAVTGHV